MDKYKRVLRKFGKDGIELLTLLKDTPATINLLDTFSDKLQCRRGFTPAIMAYLKFNGIPSSAYSEYCKGLDYKIETQKKNAGVRIPDEKRRRLSKVVESIEDPQVQMILCYCLQ